MAPTSNPVHDSSLGPQVSWGSGDWHGRPPGPNGHAVQPSPTQEQRSPAQPESSITHIAQAAGRPASRILQLATQPASSASEQGPLRGFWHAIAQRSSSEPMVGVVPSPTQTSAQAPRVTEAASKPLHDSSDGAQVSVGAGLSQATPPGPKPHALHPAPTQVQRVPAQPERSSTQLAQAALRPSARTVQVSAQRTRSPPLAQGPSAGRAHPSMQRAVWVPARKPASARAPASDRDPLPPSGRAPLPGVAGAMTRSLPQASVVATASAARWASEVRFTRGSLARPGTNLQRRAYGCHACDEQRTQ